jgi:hypothetical protein
MPVTHTFTIWMIAPHPANGSAIDLEGNNLRHFTNYVFSSDAEALSIGESQNTRLVTTSGTVDGVLTCVNVGILPVERSGRTGQV